MDFVYVEYEDEPSGKRPIWLATGWSVAGSQSVGKDLSSGVRLSDTDVIVQKLVDFVNVMLVDEQ